VFGDYKKYWFVAREAFAFIEHGHSIQIKKDTEWDRNSSNAPPTVKVQPEN
jgi:hypothetical protein